MKKYTVLLLFVLCSLACSTVTAGAVNVKQPKIYSTVTETCVPTPTVTAQPTKTPLPYYVCTVIVDHLNIRAEPNEFSEILDTVSKGDTIIVSSIDGEWYQIKDKNEYVKGKYLKCELALLP